MANLYLVRIGKHDIFVFTSYFSAVEFCEKSTTWSSVEIMNKIQKIARSKDKTFYKFSV